MTAFLWLLVIALGLVVLAGWADNRPGPRC
jgi:hypothetical protein